MANPPQVRSQVGHEQWEPLLSVDGHDVVSCRGMATNPPQVRSQVRQEQWEPLIPVGGHDVVSCRGMATNPPQVRTFYAPVLLVMGEHC
jgi:hypothetical protein